MTFTETTPVIVRWGALLVAMVLAIATVGQVATAIEGERTGKAFYKPTIGLPYSEPVTRVEAPEKFKQSVAILWFEAVACGVTALVSFSFYRRLSN